MDKQCRVSVEENYYQQWLCSDEVEEWFDEDAAMEEYYDEKEVTPL